MATVTDLLKNQVTEVDRASVQVEEDSNVNVYEFGNLILADVFPTLLWLINFVTDTLGSLVEITDENGNSISLSDLEGSQISLSDLDGIAGELSDSSGSLVSVTDEGLVFSEDSNVNVFEFANLILADIFPTVTWIVNRVLDSMGSDLSVADESLDNSIPYDSTLHIYNEDLVSFEGYTPEGYVTEMTGSVSTVMALSGS